MTVTELKKAITKKNIPTKMIWVDQNHTLMEHYLDQVSLVLNRRIKKVFSQEQALQFTSLDFDSDNTIYLLYLPIKEVFGVLQKLGDDIVAIAVVEEAEKIPLKFETITFGKISKNACLVFIENYISFPKKSRKKDDDYPEETVGHHISRDLLEELVDYFDSNLDLCMNEIRKVEVLELNGSWDHPFKALLDALPKKDTKLRSLPWFSGGDIDTCQVIYNLYIKKLRTLTGAPIEEQEIWAKLVREAIWCEACIVSGLIGDYVVDYLKLVEISLPGDFKVQFFPPVFFHEVERLPEWMPTEK